jgi:hypothetical protein
MQKPLGKELRKIAKVRQERRREARVSIGGFERRPDFA